MPQIAHRSERPILSLIVSMLLYIALPVQDCGWLDDRQRLPHGWFHRWRFLQP
jgi:hypothetical protein